MLIEKINEFSVPSKCPIAHADSGVPLTNFTSGKRITDVLHSRSVPIKCSESSCKGSLMTGQSGDPGFRTKEEILEEARKFQELYLSTIKTATPEDLTKRMAEITEEVTRTGTYHIKLEETAFGAKMAWRNASRCIGRIQWNKLHVNDCRHVTTTQEMFESICKHLEYATNGGNIRSTITLFPPRVEGREDFRVWNPQLINFAGYLQPDGTVIGDPGRLQFTRVCQRLGWKGKGGRWDILPIVLSAPGEEAKYYELPEELVMMLDIEHPRYPWFKDLDIHWYAVPAVSEMMLDMGGLCFTAAPFNGWYMATEIGARNLCDVQRYNIAKEVAEMMGLDTMTHTSLWKDIALVETTAAVLHSFQKNTVTIVDHHTAADTFMKHMETEISLRGGCPADWVWIVPPISGCSTPVFHQEMINYNLKPSYEYQEKAWKTYNWPKTDKIKLKYSFASIAKVVRLCLNMMAKARSGRTQATILYASETGKSETFARKLGNVLHASFNTRILCMDDYDTSDITSEDFIIVVASTFGSGEPPDNGKSFWKNLKELKDKKATLENLKYTVFALGSSSYPNFCMFGKNVDNIFSELGGKRVMQVELADELGGQEHAFNVWLPSVFKASCKDFNIELSDDVMNMMDMNTWKEGHFRLVGANVKQRDLLIELSKLHNKKLFSAHIFSRENLQAPEAERQTVLARMAIKRNHLSTYEPGDHIAVFPSNPSPIVESILQKLEKDGIRVDDVIQTECLKNGLWEPFKRLPSASLRSYLSHYLDITTPPTSSFLLILSQMATDSFDKHRLKKLAEVPDDYETWKSFLYPNLAEILEEFSSIKLDPTLLISELPLLQPRYYSISSSRLATPDEIHITFSMVSYRTRDNKGPMHHGVCTSFLNNGTNEDILCFIRSAPRFRLPENIATPIIMVAAGSGIAPFRSFWQERDALFEKHKKESAETITLGQMYLFFGCRQCKADDIYRSETTPLVKKGVLTKVFTALSREPGKQKEYVQHRLEKESEVVLDVLNNGGHIYVCGDAVMATDVRSTINRILSNANKNMDIDTLSENGYYHEDVFGVLHKK